MRFVEAYYLYRPEDERDYGQEAIEILLQEMESERGSLVVVFAGYPTAWRPSAPPTPAFPLASPTT